MLRLGHYQQRLPSQNLILFAVMAEINIQHLTNLAQLKLSAPETEAVRRDLAAIITMVDEMQSMDTSGIAPLAHPLDQKARLRSDEVTETVDRDLLQSGAPATADGFYLVPRVVE